MKFDEHRHLILKALKGKDFLHIEEPVSLVNGFYDMPFKNVIDGFWPYGYGKPDELGRYEVETIPTIMLVGDSGRIYYIALYTLLDKKMVHKLRTKK